MKHLLTSALTLIVMAAALGAQEVPRAGDLSQWEPQERPVGTLPKNLVDFPAKFRVKNCTDDHGSGCCGWVSMKALLLQAGYTAEAEGLDVRQGGVFDNGQKSQLDSWLDEHEIDYDCVHCGQSHDWKFLKTHLPCLVMFNCADSDYGYCEEDAEGWFDRRHRQPRMRPPGHRKRNAGHVAVIAGWDGDGEIPDHIYIVANRPSNYSAENYQQIDAKDFDERWYGYCLCLKRRHRQPQVQPPAPSPAAPEPVAPAPAAPPNIVIQISQVLDQKLDPLVKRIEVLEKKQQVMEERIRVIHSPPAK